MSKIIYRNSDLAINGAPPARKQPDPAIYPGGMLIGDEEEQAVIEVIRSKRLFRYYGPNPGPSKVDQLEREFGKYTGAGFTLAVTSCTAALVCALHGLAVGPGDEVIVPAYTWIATAEAVLAVGAVPVIADVDDTLTMDPQDIERRITPHTRAIIVVHMRGVPAQMDEILEVAHRHSLPILEDVAQANGATYHDVKLGLLGEVGCFSLQFNKVITCGEGGLVITNNRQVWQRAVMFHDPVAGRRYEFPDDETMWGVNFRMPELTAAVALAQLGKLNGLLDRLRARKRMLVEGLAPALRASGFSYQRLPDPAGDIAIALILFANEPSQAMRITRALSAENINASVLYRPDVVDYHIYTHWIPLVHHRQWSGESGPWQWAHSIPQYTAEACPKSLDLLGRAIHLNINPFSTNQEIEETIEGLNKVITLLA